MKREKLSKNGMNNWWLGGTLYQVYLMSYYDSNYDGIGDIPGLTSRLPYLHDLGVSAIWISPFTESPLEDDFGYGPASLVDINPIFGTNADFDHLISTAESYGIRVIMEWAVTNCSTAGAWFQESKKSRNGPKADWFLWEDQIPNNWKCVSGGSAWHYSGDRNQYYLGTFFKEHADLNWRSEEVQAAVLDSMRSWLDKGVKGFRIDTVNMYIKDEQLRDEEVLDTPAFPLDKFDRRKIETLNTLGLKSVLPEYYFQDHRRTINQPEVLDIIIKYRRLCDEYGEDIYLLGELDKISDFGSKACEAGLNQAFNFTLTYSDATAKEIKGIISKEARKRENHQALNAFSNHDLGRVIGRIPEDRNKKQYAKLLALLTFTLPGTPMVYYGEEIGLGNVELEPFEFKDPMMCRFPYLTDIPVFNREVARGPMKWDENNEFDGFARIRPWIKNAPSTEDGGVEQQLNNPRSMLTWYKALIRFRKTSPALSIGDFSLIEHEHPEVIIFTRSTKEEKLMVILNFSDERITLPSGISLSFSRFSTNKIEGSVSDFRHNDECLDSTEGAVWRI